MSRADANIASPTRQQLSANAIWSLIGEAAPFAFALPAVPLLIHLIGTERFGVLSIIWVAIGYFNLFDLGLGRAVTHFAAERIGAGHRGDVSEIIWGGLAVILPLGLIATIIIALSASALTAYIETAHVGEDEIAASLRCLAVGIPFVMVTTVFKGLLQAAQAFRTISQIQLPLGALVFLGPVLVAWSGYPELEYLTLALLAGRACICVWYILAAARIFPEIVRPSFSGQRLKVMLRYSGWIAVSNFIGPMMIYCDRVIVGAYLGAAAVAHYATPFDVITRTSIFAVSIAAVVFPAVAYMGQAARPQVVSMMEKGQLMVAICTLPVYFGLAAFSGDLLELWINPEFAAAGSLPAALICAGMFANSVARIPHAVLQGRGRADLTAIGHLIELPIYFAALFLLLPAYGLAGVAACWTARVLLDYAILQFFAGRLLELKITRSIVGPAAAVVVLVIVSSAGSFPFIVKVAGILIALSILAAISHVFGFSPSKLLSVLRRQSKSEL